MADTYEANSETFRQNQKVSLTVKLHSGGTRRIAGSLLMIKGQEAYVDTPLGIFVGDIATLESEE